ncbi:MAG: hypothetical protein JNK72_03475 [Myxococcales bacterium]|nr:hypothetical protein [Myxococcales bacterium]
MIAEAAPVMPPMFDHLLGETRRHAGPVAYTLGNLASVDYLSAMAETEWLTRSSPEQVRAVSHARLHRYLEYCYTHSAFWRDRWPARWRRFSVDESEAVLADLPVLTKEDLRRHGDKLHIKPSQRHAGDGYPGVPGQIENFSGGSTGVPTKVWQDARFAARNRAVIDHAYRTLGVYPGRPTFYLWGSNNELTDIQATPRKRLSTWARGLIALPSFAIGPERVRAYVERIDRAQHVDQAICFVHALDTFTRVLEHDKIAMRRLRRVITGGGKLHPELRERILRTMADEVYEIYGGRDIGLVGMEALDHSGIVTFPWHNHVEVLSNGRAVGDGERGEVHITCLQNYSFAMLRLALGDVACHQARPPGRNRSGIGDVLGRSVEHLTAPNGARIDPVSVVHLIGVLEERPWIRRFQLQQTGFTAATLRVELWHDPGEAARESYRTTLAAALSRVFEAPMTLKLEVHEAIAPSASGKHFYCIGWTPPA